MTRKEVEIIVAPGEAHFVGDGFRVHNFIPSKYPLDMERTDPFIMMDYNAPYHFDATETPRGVGVHPHRGFETVTIAYQGKVQHHDSSGGGGIIGEGDVQWMTAASGVLHKEYHEKEWSKLGGIFQMVQLWVNLPAKYKMSPPKYQAISRKNITIAELPNQSGTVEIIAGEYTGQKGPAETFSPIHMLNVKLNNGGKAPFTFPSNFNTMLLVVKGSVRVNNELAQTNHLVLFKNDGENFVLESPEESVVLILSGKPLNEPIAAHGPFVMNNQRELLQAFNDYNAGKFGHLAD